MFTFLDFLDPESRAIKLYTYNIHKN